jgi:hypothetical protein
MMKRKKLVRSEKEDDFGSLLRALEPEKAENR